MTECRCASDGGDYCYEGALLEVDGDQFKRSVVELVNRSRRAQGLPFHVIDRVALQKVAQIMVRAAEEREREARLTPQEKADRDLRSAEMKATTAVRDLERERAKHGAVVTKAHV